MKLVLVPLALAELRNGAAFYTAATNVDLGISFLAEFERTARFIRANPGSGTIFRGSRRRYPLKRFPYSVIYQIAGEELRVIALAHQRRRPGYWANRK